MTKNNDKIQNLLRSSSQPHLETKNDFFETNEVFNEDFLMPTDNAKASFKNMIKRLNNRRISSIESSTHAIPAFKTMDNINFKIKKFTPKLTTNDFRQAKPLSNAGVIYQAILKNKNETLNNINTGRRRDVFASLSQNLSKGSF